MTKALFDTVRSIKGGPLTQGDVDQINQSLKEPAAAGARFDFHALMKVVASPKADPAYLKAMADELTKEAVAHEMTTKPRVAEFIAQIANETGGFTKFSENLNYSAKRLTEVWPKRYPNLKAASPYANNPQALANHTYANRMGNGPPASGDGWKFRGRDPLMHTGRENYEETGKRMGLDLVNNPDLLLDPAIGMRAALDFWRHNKVNDPIDRGDNRGARFITNGGYIGVEEVARLRNKLLAVM